MRGTTSIQYSTPRYIQLRRRQAQPYRASKKPTGYCIRLKGPHRFTFVEAHPYSFGAWVADMHEFQCIGCGKKKFVEAG